MTKLELLDAINAKKQEVIDLVNADKLDEAKEAKAELVTMQDKFDLLEGMEPEATKAPENTMEVNDMPKEIDAIHDFAEAARHGFRNTATEGTDANGGYTVPRDIQTAINRYKEDKFSLKSLVRVENVSTMSGRRVFQTKATHTGFSSVNEAGAIGAKDTPTFTPVNYTIGKYAGYMPATNELLEDSDQNITDVLIAWLGDEAVATENTQILAKIAPDYTEADDEIAGLDGIKKILNVTLGQAYAEGAAIITNDDGFNWLDTLKVGANSNEYLLKPAKDPSAPIQYYLAVGARRVPLIVVPNSILASGTKTEDQTTHALLPFIVGDLKEGIFFFDRNQLSVMTSNTASVSVTSGGSTTVLSAFESDITLFRGIMRFAAVVRDAGAFVSGYVKN